MNYLKILMLGEIRLKEYLELKINNLISFFNYPRVNKFQKEAARKTLVKVMEDLGYSTKVSSGKHENIETNCTNPVFLISAHYDGPFLIKTRFARFVERALGPLFPYRMVFPLLIAIFTITILVLCYILGSVGS